MDQSPRISLLISQALGLYRQRINALLAQHHIDLTSEMVTVLRILWHREGRKQQEIADVLHKDKASITKVIHNMEKRGLVARMADETDARNKKIMLTAEGLSLKEKVLPVLDPFLDSVTAGFDEKELAAARGVLSAIIRQLQ
ncbi:MarR family transcriptional regulator [Chitinophaga oryzae]|uniref:MarR family transcriptional regulator n=1 Tax=Chitinophaga oryzae TaxID=2725414 RepID=A0AAE7DAR8_9BACT|nr:MarR family transcriptional regulator [Chitinophaga oryzae]QJB35582.1 MarR family transcriptional regulator [Chitinophaga oryzae]QJB42124.1 MarR family transcriptional regulator [Chitinophaga oryzae]